ncbi:uncharacterized protein TNCV_783581 [Trichonephila clavipes]|nr:uncharacterized protein TNCV_783581 [Trichonephila clavipes]
MAKVVVSILLSGMTAIGRTMGSGSRGYGSSSGRKSWSFLAWGLGSNPGEAMDVCKCIVPSRHGNTLNNRRAASPLVRLVARDERWETPDHSQRVLP